MSYVVSLPDDVYRKAAELAAREHMPVDEFVSAALSEQLAAREYLARRAARASEEKFRAALDHVSDAEPEEY
ncbi:MAG: toxin-antitoxin system HicB family antitoxin, partial [Bryobacteraceae bacterium]